MCRLLLCAGSARSRAAPPCGKRPPRHKIDRGDAAPEEDEGVGGKGHRVPHRLVDAALCAHTARGRGGELDRPVREVQQAKQARALPAVRAFQAGAPALPPPDLPASVASMPQWPVAEPYRPKMHTPMTPEPLAGPCRERAGGAAGPRWAEGGPLQPPGPRLHRGFAGRRRHAGAQLACAT